MFIYGDITIISAAALDQRRIFWTMKERFRNSIAEKCFKIGGILKMATVKSV